MLLDSTGELVSKYNVKRVPRLFVVEDGAIEYAQDVLLRGLRKDLKEAIEEALTDEKTTRGPQRPETAQTAPERRDDQREPRTDSGVVVAAATVLVTIVAVSHLF